MSWTAPAVTRIDEPFTGPERGILEGFLDWHRSTLLWKCAGLTGEQLARKAVARASLDDEFTGGRGRTLSLRWVYTHMIEEYARHIGHADLLRQRVDGTTGS
jgi:Protein of unknown function (DUF664)